MPRQTVASGEGQLAGTQPVQDPPAEPMVTKPKKDGTINLACKFGSIGIGDKQVRLGVKIASDAISPELPERLAQGSAEL